MYILVVDDDNEIRDVFSMAFTAAGHEVKTAATGAEALEVVERHQFDAVLLDVEMPTMSGWKVLEAIRKVPEQQRMPVIVFTGNDNALSDAYAKMLGAYTLLHKPTPVADILQVITRAIEERKATEGR